MENDFIYTYNGKDIEISNLKLEAKRSDIKLRSFFESSSVIHLLIDAELTLIDYNRAAHRFIQKYHGINICHGMKIMRCMHNEHKSGFMGCYTKALMGIPSRIERKLDYRGQKINWFLNYEPATDSEGQVIGMSFNALDITEKLASEQKISSQYHSLNEIAHIQSHNLRKPVANMVGLMDIFRTEGYTSTRESLLMLERTVKDLQQQMSQIEGFTR